MRANAPKGITLTLAVILAVLGVVGQFFLPALSAASFWLLLAGFALLLAGNLFKGI